MRNSRNYTLELSCFFFSFPQYTFTSHSPTSNSVFYSELPENICGFHAALGAPGIQLSEVCSLHWDCLETAEGPWNSPTFMPLNKSKPPLSLFAFDFFSLCSSLPPWVTGVRQACCVQVCACSAITLCIRTSKCMCRCTAASQDVSVIWYVYVCTYIFDVLYF